MVSIERHSIVAFLALSAVAATGWTYYIVSTPEHFYTKDGYWKTLNERNPRIIQYITKPYGEVSMSEVNVDTDKLKYHEIVVPAGGTVFGDKVFTKNYSHDYVGRKNFWLLFWDAELGRGSVDVSLKLDPIDFIPSNRNYKHRYTQPIVPSDLRNRKNYSFVELTIRNKADVAQRFRLGFTVGNEIAQPTQPESYSPDLCAPINRQTGNSIKQVYEICMQPIAPASDRTKLEDVRIKGAKWGVVAFLLAMTALLTAIGWLKVFAFVYPSQIRRLIDNRRSRSESISIDDISSLKDIEPNPVKRKRDIEEMRQMLKDISAGNDAIANELAESESDTDRYEQLLYELEENLARSDELREKLDRFER